MPIVSTNPNPIDRNAKSLGRIRRNFQRLADGAANTAIKVSAPITNTAGTLGLSLAAAGGLFNNSGLSVKLADTSLALAAGGLSANLAANSGLQVAAGLLLKLADNSLKLAAGGVSAKLDAAGTITAGANGLIVGVDGTTVKIVGNQLTASLASISPLTTKGDLFTFSTVNTRLPVGTNGQFLVAASGQTTGLQWIAGNSDTSLAGSATGLAVALAANSGLTVSSGVKLLLTDTSLVLGAGGVALNLATNSGLQISSGVLLKLTDTSLVLASTGVAVNLATNSGLTVSSGVKLLLADATLALAVGGLSVNLSTTGCITNAGAGLQLKFGDASHTNNLTAGLIHTYADSSLTTTLSGMRANLATNGGLTVSTGMLVRGQRISAGNPTGLADGDTWYDSTAKGPRQQNDGLVQSTSGLIATNLADSTTVSNVSAQTFFDVTQALPAAYFTAGKTYRIRAMGTYNYTGAPTVAFALQLTNAGGTVQVSTPTFTPTGTVGGRWLMEMVTTCRSTGVSGVFSRMGFQYVETGGLAGTNTLYPAGGTTQTTDTTSALTVKASVTFNTASVSNSAVLHMLTVEPLN